MSDPNKASGTSPTSFQGARLLCAITPQFAFHGSLPTWQTTHLGEYLVPVHKPILCPVYNPLGQIVRYERTSRNETEQPDLDPEKLDPQKGVTVPANPHRFDPDTHTMGADTFVVVPHIGLPKTPQPTPPRAPNAELYDAFFIPSIHRVSVAKTQAGQDRFREWRESAFFQRRMQYDLGKQLLDESGWEGDYTDRRDYCPQCGATFFERKNGKLRCRDCRWELREAKWKETRDRFSPREDDELTNLYVTNEGLRETDGSRLHDHQTRADWFPKWASRFNPSGKEWEDVTGDDVQDIKADPDFTTEVARYPVLFSGTPIKSNTLVKQLSRTFALPSWVNTLSENVEGTGDGVYAVIHLNGRDEVKRLGEYADTDKRMLRNLLRFRKETEKAALKGMRRKARANGWTDKMVRVETKEIKHRIQVAYQGYEDMLKGGGG